MFAVYFCSTQVAKSVTKDASLKNCTNTSYNYVPSSYEVTT